MIRTLIDECRDGNIDEVKDMIAAGRLVNKADNNVGHLCRLPVGKAT